MKQIFLFKIISDANKFGIGTAQSSLITAMEKSICHINIVTLYSDVYEKKEYGRTTKLSLPMPKQTYITNGVEYKEAYLRSIYMIFKPKLEKLDKDNVIFYIDYLELQTFVKLLKEDFPSCKVISTIHYFPWSMISYDVNYIFNNLTKNPKMNRSIEQEIRLFKDSDEVICLSNNTKKILEKYYKVDSRKIIVKNNKIIDHTTKSTSNRKFFFPKEEIKILFVGRLTYDKGILFLIDAFKQLIKQIDNVRLIIIGEGELLEECISKTRYFSDKVSYLGYLDQSEIHEIYRVVDVGIIPSVHEQCSMVGIEMLMHGLAIVASNAPGLDEMFFNKSNAYVFNIKNKKTIVKNLSKSLQLALQSNNSDFKKNARQSYLENYLL